MTKELVKEAFQLAEDELKQKKTDEVKKIVLKTLERIDELSKEKHKLEEKIRILRLDVEDLKDGKIDRIVERQEKDLTAKNTSVVVIIKETVVSNPVNPWYWPYRIYWQDAYPMMWNNYTTTTASTCSGTTGTTYATIDCSSAKDATIGTYCLSNGTVTHLR